ncbi:hypothetical protein D3C81_1170200 [compost metagenome]
MLKEAVEGVVNRTFGGVFHGHHTKVDGAGRHFAEHFVDRRHRLADHGVTKVLHGRGLGKSTLRAEVGDFERLLQGQAGGHDFTEQPRHLFVAQRPLIALHDALEHLRLTLRTVEDRLFTGRQSRHLHPRHFLGAAGTVTDQLEDLLVEAVNAHPQRLEFLLRHQPCSFSNSAM